MNVAKNKYARELLKRDLNSAGQILTSMVWSTFFAVIFGSINITKKGPFQFKKIPSWFKWSFEFKLLHPSTWLQFLNPLKGTRFSEAGKVIKSFQGTTVLMQSIDYIQISLLTFASIHRQYKHRNIKLPYWSGKLADPIPQCDASISTLSTAEYIFKYNVSCPNNGITIRTGLTGK